MHVSLSCDSFLRIDSLLFSLEIIILCGFFRKIQANADKPEAENMQLTLMSKYIRRRLERAYQRVDHRSLQSRFFGFFFLRSIQGA